MTRRTRPDEGFSLVELLMVILILGVLAAISIPVLAGQRQKAYAAVMTSDLRAAITAQNAWIAEHPIPTADPTMLATQGYRQSAGASLPHVKVSATAYVVCVTHQGADHWLVYDSGSDTTSTSPTDCL